MPAEDCAAFLDVNWMNRRGMLADGAAGPLRWTSTATGRQRAAAGFRTAGGVLTLDYLAGGEPVTIPVPLLHTRPNYGGRRPWFLCPLAKAGVPCGRRVGKLYLRDRLFGCRHCHELTYRSAQEAHADERTFAALGLPVREAKWLREDVRFMEKLRRRDRERDERERDRRRSGAR